jgi:predicted helicase
VYVKAFRWASDRILKHGEGIVAFVTNSSFVESLTFDGMRRHLAQDFDALYLLDLGGNVRKNPKLSGTTHNVFGIQVGVSISFLVKKKISQQTQARIYYAQTGEHWRKEEKYDWLDQKHEYQQIEWQEITPDARHTWLTEGLSADFDAFLPMGAKEAKSSHLQDVQTIFKNYGRGVATCRDAWAYHFNQEQLAQNISRMIETYDEQVFKWSRFTKKPEIDTFVLADDTKISWSEGLKNLLKRQFSIKFDENALRDSLYRPFTKEHLYFDKYLNERRYQMPSIFPTPDTETENLMICISGIGSNKPFQVFMTNLIPCLDMLEKTQCFPFYTYDEDGSHRRENIMDWALTQFRAQYETKSIGKWDIFYYVYALLHHPHYREQYAANLKRNLPRIPLAGVSKLDFGMSKTSFDTPAEIFWAFAEAGKQLAELHVNYEQQPEYPLQMIENRDKPLNWRMDKMKLSKDKSQIVYNDFLTLAGIPPETFEYRLGNRSALEWVLDQYRVKTDPRSGIVNDPNRPDDPEYIVRLMKQVVTVSLATVNIINELPE